MNKIITISREFGSGGRTIGKKAAEALGIPCYDHDLIDHVAEESGFAKEYIAEHGEYKQYGSWFGNALAAANSSMGGMSNSDVLWIAQRKIILKLAQEGPCVFVGRCADYILRDRAKLLKVFIYADMQSRAKRIVDVYGESAESPEKRLKNKDKRRAAYYKFYTETEWGVAKNYSVCLNSGELGVDKCAEIIVDLYNNM